MAKKKRHAKKARKHHVTSGKKKLVATLKAAHRKEGKLIARLAKAAK